MVATNSLVFSCAQVKAVTGSYCKQDKTREIERESLIREE